MLTTGRLLAALFGFLAWSFQATVQTVAPSEPIEVSIDPQTVSPEVEPPAVVIKDAEAPVTAASTEFVDVVIEGEVHSILCLIIVKQACLPLQDMTR